MTALSFLEKKTWGLRLDWTGSEQETNHWTISFQKGSNYLTSRTTSNLGDVTPLHRLPSDAASCTRRADTASASLRRPKTLLLLIYRGGLLAVGSVSCTISWCKCGQEWEDRMTAMLATGRFEPCTTVLCSDSLNTMSEAGGFTYLVWSDPTVWILSHLYFSETNRTSEKMEKNWTKKQRSVLLRRSQMWRCICSRKKNQPIKP